MADLFLQVGLNDEIFDGIINSFLKEDYKECKELTHKFKGSLAYLAEVDPDLAEKALALKETVNTCKVYFEQFLK
jgi:hypothetical protein